MKLSNLEKYSYGFGALGKDLACAIVFTYLMVYCTDVLGISAAFVGGLFFVARFWDAINDPIMGMLVDNTRTKWGKFRPWILVGTIVNAVALVFLFSTPAGLEGKSVYIYASVAYIVWGMTYTMMDIPYWSMIPSLTSNKEEREKVAVIPRIFASSAWLIVGSFGLPIVAFLGKGDSLKGWSLFSIGIAVVFVLSSVVTVFNVKERTVVQKDKKKITFKETLQTIWNNDQLRALVGTVLSFNMAMQLSGGFAIYYFTYVIGNEALFPVFMMLSGIAEMSGLALFPKLAQKLSRPVVYTIACGLPVVGFTMLLLAGIFMPQNAILVGASGAILKLGSGFALALSTVMLADVVDYGEYKLGTRNESVVFSVQTLLVKFAGAIAGLVVGVGLSLVGYVPNAVQSASTVLGMRVLMIGVPIGLAFLSLFIYRKFYKLNGAFHDKVLEELENRKETVKKAV